ncbi:DUF167 domain-containing protein [Geothermobacter hydrogeniphilus]|uniref:UPF0235 protein B5V00_15990 n=1 Tax=Geothermobacter hydrogeniphilus TaxID=1969733 RepID=A0A1X0XN46_9BACT|nr:DUF167 family protein [Geothermobacter hydrogeniphilus]ORJ54268.1 YggU family protein [Geothermobacter hydrogeniphilus]
MPCLQSTADGVVLAILVQPRASRNQLVGMQGNELKVRLTSPPVEGAANKLCGRFFSKLFGIARGQVELIAGDKSRHKRLLLHGVSESDARRVLSEYLPSDS